MFGTELLLADRQGTLEDRFRACEIALFPKQPPEVIEARCRIGMLGTEDLFRDR
jgi:hypothetical protein